MTFSLELLVIFLMLVSNAIFAAYEMALASISQARMAVLVNEKKKGAAEAGYMKNRMEASLAMVQLGITLVGAIAAAIGGAGVGETLAPYFQSQWGFSELWAEVLALTFFIIPLTMVTIVFAELVPKMLALNNKEWVVLAMSPVMKFLVGAAYPLISLLEAAVKRVVEVISPKRTLNPADERTQGLHELKAAVALARASRLLGSREEKIVLSAAQLSARAVREIMIPATDIFMIPRGSSLTDAFLKAHLDMHTRFPVCDEEGNPQSIQGYVNFKDIMVALKINPTDPTIRGITRPILRLDEKMTISQVLEKMIQDKAHIVLVTGRENVILGLVTLEDIIEELVGEIEDEFDRHLTHIKPYGSSWLVGGGVPMTKVVAAIGFDWTDKFVGRAVPTLSEWCEEKNGRPLVGGEVIESDNVRVAPRKFRRRKMSEAIISVM